MTKVQTFTPHIYLTRGDKGSKFELFLLVKVKEGYRLAMQKAPYYRKGITKVDFQVVKGKSTFDHYDAHRVSFSVPKSIVNEQKVNHRVDLLIQNDFSDLPEEVFQVMSIPYDRKDRKQINTMEQVAQNRAYIYFKDTPTGDLPFLPSVLVPMSNPDMLYKMLGLPLDEVASDGPSTPAFSFFLSFRGLLDFIVRLSKEPPSLDISLKAPFFIHLSVDPEELTPGDVLNN